MSLFSKLFGGGGRGGGGAAAKGHPAETYEGFTITPAPTKEAGGWRIGAHIVKEVGGETKSHHLIRADTLDSADTAAEASVAKARMLIDQVGERLFD